MTTSAIDRWTDRARDAAARDATRSAELRGPQALKRLLWVAAFVAIADRSDAAGPATRSPAAGADAISIRTESYPRPPYSGATYYLYERDGVVVCTKLEVCNKYDVCETAYFAGRHRAEEDVRTGEPYARTGAVPIAREKLARHRCLVKFPPD